MAKRCLFLAAFMALGALGIDDVSNASGASTCMQMKLVKDNGKDAVPAIAECLKHGAGRVLQLLPGTYHLLTPLVIDRPVSIETTPIASGQTCSKFTGAHCAVLAIGQMPPELAPGVMPIEIVARNVRLQSLVIAGAGSYDSPWQHRVCLDPHDRPLGGGVRVSADNFQMANVLLKGVSCYTAMEVSAGVKKIKLSNNIIVGNGNHENNMMWADGLTIHDAAEAIIENNIFRDNTDVQLILGGCRRCSIKNNKFYHSADFKWASFAELMLHAWPTTSGNFVGSITSGNSVNCGQNKRCGYGIMIGGEPWYSSKAYGGAVTGNTVKNALMGLNVDRLTGAMTIQDNIVKGSGGVAISDCGKKYWPSVNISPRSKEFLMSNLKIYKSIETGKCLLGRVKNN